ncbi:iron-siderophore ABC transporter substrate-binding protein [Celeribacter indicus]|uniref:Ferric enterobactin-binding periplasmic protein FepB n=1 Tax=Celeribacter indicus TaxID=1208324 RepID=A0A0B5E0R4_9RHOB|nr:iron-siderophore ABC transporter substrate-binding protein [Celeribacter indicus]AJE48864.1 ferric enterobactin-binding periplasmic protein FepB [Celeribacter indicus]SDW39524.1 iron complex transport system substrate-binding protein [Celeribacter indicus]
MSPQFAKARSLCAGLLAGLSLLAAAAHAQDYPIEIEHAFGKTVIEEKPERVATVAWANHEVPIALGVVPVGFAAANFGDDDGDGVLPWVEAGLEELGAETPVLFDEGDGIDFEAVAATAPDVILAAYSGLSASDYETLSRIAPVVAYPEAAWSTDWRDMIRLNSAGIGMVAEGEALIARLEEEIARTRAAHPELEGKSAMFVTHLSPTDLSRISFYTDNDSRVRFFHDLGLASPQVVKEASEAGRFSGEISAERIDALADVDILVTYGGRPLLDSLSANLLTSRLPAVGRDALVMLRNDPLGTAANPTPMSLPWVLDDYAGLLSDAARHAE